MNVFQKMRNLRRVLNLKERNASCVYILIHTHRYRKKSLLLFLREQLKTSRLFLNSIPSPLLGEFLSYFFPSFSFFFFFFTKVPKAFQKHHPVDHSSNVTRSRFIILKAASAPPKIKMRSPQQLPSSILISPTFYQIPFTSTPSYCLSPLVEIFRDPLFRTPLFPSLVGLYTLSGGGEKGIAQSVANYLLSIKKRIRKFLDIEKFLPSTNITLLRK